MQWRAHLFERLRRQIELRADGLLVDLLNELRSYPASGHENDSRVGEDEQIVIPLKLRTAHGTLAFISTTMIFGTPRDVMSSELAIESFFPADPATAQALQYQIG